METLTIRRRSATRLLATALVLPLFLLTAACDTSDPNGVTGEVVVQGAVTTEAGHTGETPGGEASTVEGAVVTAAAVTATGQFQPLSGEATTDAEGRYLLTTQATLEPIRLQAEAEDFRAAVILEAGLAAGPAPGGVVQAPPMSAESTAEADVYVQARTQTPAITVGDASAHVTARTAVAINEGRTTVDEVATAVAASAATEAAFALRPAGGAASEQDVEAARQERRHAYAAFRSQIVAATTLEQRRAAVDAFLEAYADAYAQAGLSHSRQAQASLAGSGAAVRFAVTGDTDAAFATAHRARLLAALNAALAVEQEFAAAGASDGRLDVLAQARASFVAAVRAAATAQAIAEAFADYRSAVRAELAAELNVSPATIDAAFDATAAARATLDAALAGATNAHIVADAYVAFFTSAREAVQAELGAEAAFAIEVVATMAAF